MGDCVDVDTNTPLGVGMSGYDAFEHLTSSLFSASADLFAMLTVYFDDSGNQDISVVAGYLGTKAMWEQFNKRWSTLLKEYDIAQLHRSELESFWGEFKGWTPERRTEFIIKANIIIRRCTYVPIGLAIIKKDFEESFPPNHVGRRFRLYSWCVHACLAYLGKWCKAHNNHEPIHFVFEAGTEGQDQINETFAMLYANPDARPPDACPIGSWTFSGKQVQPLQAADVVAYELFKLVNNFGIEDGRRKVRASALGLFDKPLDISFLGWFDKKTLAALRGEKVPGWDY